MADRSYGRKFYQQIQLATKVTRLESLRLFFMRLFEGKGLFTNPKNNLKANIAKELTKHWQKYFKINFFKFSKKLNGGHVENK